MRRLVINPRYAPIRLDRGRPPFVNVIVSEVGQDFKINISSIENADKIEVIRRGYTIDDVDGDPETDFQPFLADSPIRTRSVDQGKAMWLDILARNEEYTAGPWRVRHPAIGAPTDPIPDPDENQADLVVSWIAPNDPEFLYRGGVRARISNTAPVPPTGWNHGIYIGANVPDANTSPSVIGPRVDGVNVFATAGVDYDTSPTYPASPGVPAWMGHYHIRDDRSEAIFISRIQTTDGSGNPQSYDQLYPVEAPAPTTFVALPSPSSSALTSARGRAVPIYNETGSSNQNVGFNGGYTLALAVSGAAGHAADANEALGHIKGVANNGNEPSVPNGYGCQHEMHIYAPMAYLRNSPIWNNTGYANSLTENDKAKCDTIMLAGLIGNAFFSSDNNPYILAGTQQRDLRGGTNLSRNWNANFRCAYPMNVLIAMAYFGGVEATNTLLQNFNLTSFISTAQSQGLTRIVNTFTRQWTNGPTAAQIHAAVQNYIYRTYTLSQFREIVKIETDYCCSKTVNKGLNNGDGISNGVLGGDNGGRVISSTNPPLLGSPGMLSEFDSIDGGGSQTGVFVDKRSSVFYSLGGYRNILQAMIVLAANGLWDKSRLPLVEAASLFNNGARDLRWKTEEGGYDDFSLGQRRKRWTAGSTADEAEYGLPYTYSLWADTMAPYQGNLPGYGEDTSQPPPVDPDPDPTPVEPGDPAPTTNSSTVLAKASFLTHDVTFNISGGAKPVGHFMTDVFEQRDPFIVVGSGGSVQVSYTPAYGVNNGREVNGAMINPKCQAQAGFDSQHNHPDSHTSTTRYLGSLNKAKGVSTITLQAGQSLMVGVSDLSITTTRKRSTRQFVVLTALASTPTADSFRPPFAGTEKPIYRAGQIDWSKLANLTIVGTPPSKADCEGRTRRLVPDLGDNWNRDHYETADHTVLYGRDYARYFGRPMLWTNCNVPLADKRKTVLGLVQAGIDTYGCWRSRITTGSGVPWRADGGHNSGRKVMMVYAGHLLGVSAMRDFMLQQTQGYSTNRIQEDAMYFYTDQATIDATNSSSWDPPYKTSRPQEAYKSGHRNGGTHPMPDWEGNASGPHRRSASWTGHAYRHHNGMVHHGAILSILAMGLRSVWRNEAHIDYHMRFVAIMNGQEDPWRHRGTGTAAYPRIVGTTNSDGSIKTWPNWQKNWDDVWVWDMILTHRSNPSIYKYPWVA